ncbi:MutL C terminal dimerization domain-containing protein [Crassisporium funariophilum]|nr:MutL C terminal dimerization domain-containing protein [Crassisporium funariophilum]
MVPRPEIIRSETNGGDISLRFDADKVKRVWSEKPQQIHNQPEKEAIIGKVPVDAGVSNTESDDMATAALARVIEKSDFTKMEVVGQFNLGFIVVRRRKALLPTSQSNSPESDVKVDVMDDLFIVDQHAADEKYNFETLQSTTRIQSQRLYKSQPLELTAADELLAVENIEVLRQNGFEIDVDELGAVGQGSRLKLAAQPVSKSTVFDMKDLEEVIHLLRDRPTGQMVRCSKARAMFAMRACRKSVMVGMPLTQHQMTSVIRHMGTMDQPWNCPHGRPTMRHLLDIRTSGSGPQQSRGLAQVDWSSFE